MKGLRKVQLELPFDVSMETKLSAEVRPENMFEELVNVDLSRPGRISRRNGCTDLSTNMYEGGFGSPRRLAARGGELLAIKQESSTFGSGGGIGNAGDCIDSYAPGDQRWKRHAKIPRPTLRKILTMREGTAMSSSVAVLGDHMMVAWTVSDFRSSAGIDGGVLAQIYDISVDPPVLIQDTKILDSASGISFPEETVVKCIALENELIAVWNYDGLNTSAGIDAISYRPSTRTWGPQTTLVNGVATRCFDVVVVGSITFALAYNDAADNMDVAVIGSLTQTPPHFTVVGTLGSTKVGTGVVSVGVDFFGGTIFIVTSETVATYAYQTTTALGSFSVTAVAYNHVAGTTTNRYARVGVAAVNSTECWAFNWRTGTNGNPATPTDPVQCRLNWRFMESGSVPSANHFLMGVCMTQEPFVLDGRVFIGICGLDPERTAPVVASTEWFKRCGYALFEIDTANADNASATGLCCAAWAADIASHEMETAGTGAEWKAHRGCLVGSQWFCADMVIGEMHRGRTQRGLSTTNTDLILNNIDVLKFDFDDQKRWESREHHGQTVFAGGIPWCYDGHIGFECGWIWRPRIVSATPIAGGTLTADLTYSFRVVYEFLDSDENYWYSAPNYATELGSGQATATTTAANKQITLVIRAPAFSAMSKGGTADLAHPRVLIFMNEGATGDGSFYLKTAVEFNPQVTTDFIKVTIADTTDLTVGDQLYTVGNELENYAPPTGVVIENHRDRLFMFDSYDKCVKYTKPLSRGRGVEWALEQLIPTPDNITAIVSLETSLILFSTKQIYALDGYGPNAVGLPPDAFSRLILVSAEVGCMEENAAARTPVGVLFRGYQGFWLLDRTMSLKYLGSPMENAPQMSSQATVLSMDVDQKKACVRILMSGVDYDFIFNYWYDSNRWSYDELDVLAGDRTHYDAIVIGEDYYITDASHVMQRSAAWVDGSHTGSDFEMRVKTSQLRFGNMTQMKRLHRVLSSIEKVAAGPLQITVTTSESAVSTFFRWPDAELGGGKHVLRCHLPVQKLKWVQVAYGDRDYNELVSTTTEGFRLFGAGFELGLKGAAKEAEGISK